MVKNQRSKELSKAIEDIIADASNEKLFVISKGEKKEALKLSQSAKPYEDSIARQGQARAEREEAVNDLIELMKTPIKEEQENKIKYRKVLLILFLIYFLIITVIIFYMISVFHLDGFTDSESKVVQFMLSGFFVNLIALATVIFKYLFDDKNSLMKDMIQLIVETLKENNENKS